MTFEVKKTVDYWIEGAIYDLGVAKAMFRAKKYPYALFMGHLSLEKLLKALVVKETKTHAPYTHSLPLLTSKLSMEISPQMQKQLAAFMEFYFETRYPKEQQNFYRKCTKSFTLKNLNEIKKVFQWLKEKL